MKPFQVVCLASPGSTVIDVTIEREILKGVGAEVELKTAATEAATLATVRHADGILHRGGCLTSSVIAQLERCRIIAHGGVGYDAVDVSTATTNGILVTNVADYCVDEVADHALALLLALSKRLIPQVLRARTGIWAPQGAGTVQRLRDQTVAVVGYGRIGSAFGHKARQLGLRVLAVDPYVPSSQLARLGAEPFTLDEALPQADFVSLHVPLTALTRHLIGAEQLRRMKPTAYLINTARGGIVDEDALVSALTASQIAGAALDVLEHEPPAPAHPLLRLDNVLVTPHAAYYSEAALRDVRRTMAQQVADVLRGHIPQFVVNPGALGLRASTCPPLREQASR